MLKSLLCFLEVYNLAINSSVLIKELNSFLSLWKRQGGVIVMPLIVANAVGLRMKLPCTHRKVAARVLDPFTKAEQ